MPHFAVIGNPIDHSLSPIIHQGFAKQTGLNLTYETLLGDNELFEQQVKRFFDTGGQGLNVTQPFKQRAFALADVSTQRCQQAQAANTLWMQDDKLYADNTDGVGFIKDITHHLDLAQQRVLILGAGGAARGIIGPLLNAPIHSLCVFNRNAHKAQLLQQTFPKISIINLAGLRSDFDIIIHATSAALSNGQLLLPESLMQQQPFCYDLAYDLNADTPFIHQAKAYGCKAVNGIGMLIEQAAEAFSIWHGIKPHTWACGPKIITEL